MNAITVTHNERDSVSNHQRLYCLLNRLFRRRAKITSKLRVTGLCAQRASNAENVSIWWRHHALDTCFWQVPTLYTYWILVSIRRLCIYWNCCNYPSKWNCTEQGNIQWILLILRLCIHYRGRSWWESVFHGTMEWFVIRILFIFLCNF